MMEGACRYPRCGDSLRALGLCEKHYQRYKSVETYFSKAQADEGNPDPYTWHCVYVVGSLEVPILKVGRAKEIWSRVNYMQCGNPHPIRVFGAFFGKPAAVVSLEWEAHKTMTDLDLHHQGEWFHVSGRDANAVIQKLAKQRNLRVCGIEEYRRIIRNTGWSIHKEPGWDEKLERAWLSYEGTVIAEGIDVG
ncbi:GIY-YIG nuclease family protein [Paracoccus sp. CPCC 101403]|uniref:GIY-YIG nuclease family protein n=1 Tax=Paracoccus broussonetiae TaxID=3075834 RepID=A0ABU3EAD7_9RHOB|nr:GIY-YIG nuclease family protein [Paracoccus sp. CPCC 101403]MDT1061184.1 GIY-YIG nuclease family protein [Paracoccus sp. CPCC 101403]